MPFRNKALVGNSGWDLSGGADWLAQVLADLETEGVRLLAARRSAGLVYDALQGRRYVPRL